jgi:hypothetical protein
MIKLHMLYFIAWAVRGRSVCGGGGRCTYAQGVVAKSTRAYKEGEVELGRLSEISPIIGISLSYRIAG